MELLIGCGVNRAKRIRLAGQPETWSEVVTLDINPDVRPDIEWNLENLPLPFPGNHFDEIHAYHVLEHVGRQGDYRFFFAQFEDLWRILKPGGSLCGIVPAPDSGWIWGDPGHTRLILPQMMIFLDQGEYAAQVGKTAMTDYRSVYRADFVGDWHQIANDEFRFVLKAVKPSRFVP